MEELALLGQQPGPMPANDGRMQHRLSPRFFGHSSGTNLRMAGVISTKSGPRLQAFLVTEASSPAYCTSLRGGAGFH